MKSQGFKNWKSGYMHFRAPNMFMTVVSLKYFIKLINKHIRHVFYLQITINGFQTYLLISVNTVILRRYTNFFLKHTFAGPSTEYWGSI